MTVQLATSTASYTGDGATVTFSIPFEAADASYIKVYLGGVLQTVGYSIVGSVLIPGASVLFTVAPALGVAVNIVRLTPRLQNTIYTQYGKYNAKQIESDFDRMMMVMQELQYQIEHPPPIVFPPTPTAAQISFAPAGGVSAVNVQAAIEETDAEWRAADQLQVPKSTGISSADTDTLVVASPTLAQDVVLSTRTNVPLGLLKLDATGKVPTDLLQTAGLNFLGVWGPVTQGATPPVSGTQGDYYLFDAAGSMTLVESTNTTPHSVAVVINDYMVYDTSVIPGWYYVHNAQPQNIAASAVSFQPTGSIVASNVQGAIAELDSDISDRFHESGLEITIERFNGIAKEAVLASSADGVRLLRQSKDRFAVTQFGANLLGDIPNTNPSQSTVLGLLSSDGVQQAYLQIANELTLAAVRAGVNLSLLVTGASGVQSVLTATPDGNSWMYYAGNLRVGATLSGATVVGADANANPSPRASLTLLASDLIQQARVGFLGTPDFLISLNRPNANFSVVLGNGATFELTQTIARFIGISSLTVPGQVIATAVAPTAANHLTRKDYVDTRLTGFTSADTSLSAVFSVPHNLGAVPSEISAYLVNVTSQYGFTAGQFLPLPRTQAVGGTFVGYDFGADATNVWFTTTGVAPWITPKTGGVPSQITASFWRVRLFARR